VQSMSTASLMPKEVEEEDVVTALIPNDPKWRPYCTKCSTMLRMAKTDYGFRCRNCQNEIDNKMQPLKQPFNVKFSCSR
jgi:tRNA(Ile2) C34 agmatinyltransferase TiaS